MAIDAKLVDDLLKDYKSPEQIIGKNGLLKQLTNRWTPIGYTISAHFPSE